jgi:hypothetical protein
VEILCENESAAANNPNDQDHTTFWLVAADQLARRGVFCERVREKALGIIDSGSDIAMLSRLGMKPRDVKKRQRMLDDLGRHLTAASQVVKPRTVLKKPQPFLMETGEVFVFPTSGGECINSYFSSKEKIPGWSQNGWGAVIIVERGRAFDFLAWYRPLLISYARTNKPDLAQLRSEPLWVLKPPGTCTPTHFKRLELERIGTVLIDGEKLARLFPERSSGRRQAVDDISITNSLTIGPKLPAALMPTPGQPPNFRHGRPYPTIMSVHDILSA